MPIPLPPIDDIRQMRFSNDFWLHFFSLMEELGENDLFDINNIDTDTADLFFTLLAARMIDEVGEDGMPSLDDTITLIRIILAEEFKERMIGELVQRLESKVNNNDNSNN